VTALLLSCGVALEASSGDEAATARLRKIEDLAKHIIHKLALSEEEHAVVAGA
jgi:hypothetical protein